MTSAQVAYALEEGRLADAAEAHANFAACCPGNKRQHYLRLDISLAAGRGDREVGRRLFEELVASPMLYDAASTLNSVVVLVEDLLALGVGPDEVRARLIDGWLAEHPSTPRSAPTPTACWRSPPATTSGPPARWRPCSPIPTRAWRSR